MFFLESWFCKPVTSIHQPNLLQLQYFHVHHCFSPDLFIINLPACYSD
jgi:hypothetical protein